LLALEKEKIEMKKSKVVSNIDRNDEDVAFFEKAPNGKPRKITENSPNGKPRKNTDSAPIYSL